MPRKLSPEHRVELESLFRIVATITEWYDGLVAPGTPRMSDTMRRAYEASDLRGMRAAYNDLLAMTNAADPAQRVELDRLLRDRAGLSLETLYARKRQRLDRIRARGALTSEEQYYLVREHVELIAGLPERGEEAQEFAQLLNEFEERSATPKRARAPRKTS
jgi:hypothetical protein